MREWLGRRTVLIDAFVCQNLNVSPSVRRRLACLPLGNSPYLRSHIIRELDKFGMGRYQICIWFLTGFGYFLDLAWAQGVGLVASAI